MTRFRSTVGSFELYKLEILIQWIPICMKAITLLQPMTFKLYWNLHHLVLNKEKNSFTYTTFYREAELTV